jgi:hypothetical protein
MRKLSMQRFWTPDLTIGLPTNTNERTPSWQDRRSKSPQEHAINSLYQEPPSRKNNGQ